MKYYQEIKVKAATYFNMGKVKKAINYQEEAEDVDADTTKAKQMLKKHINHENSI